MTSAPIIGSIPFGPAAKKSPIIRHDDRLSRRADSFRTLRTNLRHNDVSNVPAATSRQLGRWREPSP
ncbi:MAG: hypothetical protein Q7T17_09505 [Microbacterium sp.]|uniref:hypothetical protein n=1 Tax=Microbacterium sp. TaxID=51671 RepID=UPI002721486E|nr:hypothetical protein [Microbacterium sp.]MDO8383199.1 hypothetical protein [Microbacterium sp.]